MQLEKEMATHSGILAWRIPGMVEPGGLPSTGSHRVGHDWSDLAAAAAAESQNDDVFLSSVGTMLTWMSDSETPVLFVILEEKYLKLHH